MAVELVDPLGPEHAHMDKMSELYSDQVLELLLQSEGMDIPQAEKLVALPFEHCLHVPHCAKRLDHYLDGSSFFGYLIVWTRGITDPHLVRHQKLDIAIEE